MVKWQTEKQIKRRKQTKQGKCRIEMNESLEIKREREKDNFLIESLFSSGLLDIDRVAKVESTSYESNDEKRVEDHFEDVPDHRWFIILVTLFIYNHFLVNRKTNLLNLFRTYLWVRRTKQHLAQLNKGRYSRSKTLN